jgi:hypothetical protein
VDDRWRAEAEAAPKAQREERAALRRAECAHRIEPVSPPAATADHVAGLISEAIASEHQFLIEILGGVAARGRPAARAPRAAMPLRQRRA